MKTSWPRSRVPIMAQMMIMVSASRIVWLMPSMISGSASGSWTRQKIWRLVQPDTCRPRSVAAAPPDAVIGVADRRHDGEGDGGDHAVKSPTRNSITTGMMKQKDGRSAACR